MGLGSSMVIANGRHARWPWKFMWPSLIVVVGPDDAGSVVAPCSSGALDEPLPSRKMQVINSEGA